MSQGFDARNYVDGAGRPSGGWARGKGFDITWQKGPLLVDGRRIEPNGAFVETILEVVAFRIDHYQASQFNCEENAEALAHIEKALEALKRRTARRVDAGVEGTWEGN